MQAAEVQGCISLGRQSPGLSARALLEPVGCPPLAVGLSSANSADSRFGRAVQSFTCSVILKVLGDCNKLNVSAALRPLACQLHPC